MCECIFVGAPFAGGALGCCLAVCKKERESLHTLRVHRPHIHTLKHKRQRRENPSVSENLEVSVCVEQTREVRQNTEESVLCTESGLVGGQREKKRWVSALHISSSCFNSVV